MRFSTRTSSVLMATLGLALGTLSAPALLTPNTASAAAPSTLTDLVNPFIGTKNDGNTYPGAAVPFGMVQLSPDTGHNTGYDYEHDQIRGFSSIHLSGVGCGLGGTLPIMPTTGEIASTDNAEYELPFSHDDEEAEPGYYRVALGDGAAIDAELTATEHTGAGRFTFPATTKANVLLNTGQALNNVTSSTVRVLDDRTVQTTIVSRGFCQDTNPITLHTVSRFDRPFREVGTWDGATVTPGSTGSTSTGRNGAYVRFDTRKDADVEVQTALSYVSTAGAKANLRAEAGGFERLRTAAHRQWADKLATVQVGGGSDEQRRTFYSSLYRSMLAPNTGTDVDGRYRGWDQKVHRAKGFTYYQNLSLWDTYRTQEQLLALLAPQQARDIALSILKIDEQGGWLPRWGYGSVETNIMTGDPVTPYLVSAYHEGLLKGHEDEAYKALRKNADKMPPKDSQYNGRAGNGTYLTSGYVPYTPYAKGKPGDYDIQHGASATLEYAYADATLATMAADLGHRADAKRYAQRGQNYRNVFDSTTGFFRARDANGRFVGPADPADSVGFHEGTSWQYMWLAQQNLPGLVDLIGGKDATNKRLDSFFAYDQLVKDPAKTAREVWVNGPYEYYNQDKYNPQNEPNLHAPYTYLSTGEPWKTTDVVHAALTLFTNGPDGVTGNDDLGTMSAWQVLSSMGMFPVAAGTTTWGLSTPVFDSVHVSLDRKHYPGGDLDIRAPGTSDTKRYTRSVTANGRPLAKTYVTGDALRNGLRLDFAVGAKPSAWGTGAHAAPPAIDPGETPNRNLTVATETARPTVEVGTTRSTFGVTLVASGPGSPRGKVTLSGGGGHLRRQSVPWKVRSDNLPVTKNVDLPLAIEPGTPAGEYPIRLTTRSGGRTVVTKATLVVAPRSPLALAFSQRGIGEEGLGDADLDGQGNYLARTALADDGLVQGRTHPVPGTGLTFAMPAVPTGGNDNIIASGQRLDVAAITGAARSFSLIGAATGGTATGTMTLHFDDGSTSTAGLTMSDWCAGSPATGNVQVARTSWRATGTTAENAGCGLFSSAPVTVPAGKKLVGLTLPDARTIHVFALAVDAG